MVGKIFEIWWNERHPEDKVPQGVINGIWFDERALPMIVECSECAMTMALPSAVITDSGFVLCHSCAGCEED